MDNLARWAGSCPDKPACIFPEAGTALSFAELDARASRAAQWLIGLGLQAGDRFALLLGNEPAMLELSFAAQRAGLYYVPLDTHLTPAELGPILRDSGARLLVAGAIPLGLPDLDLGCFVTGAAVPGTASYEGALAAYPRVEVLPQRPVGRDLLYSSGTTGAPKGILRPLPSAETRALPAASASVVLQRFEFGPDTVYLSTAPLYHAAPNRVTLTAIAEGGMAVVMGRFDAAQALALIDRFEVTHSQWVPTMFVRLLALPDATRACYSGASHRIAVHAAAPCPVEVKRRMIAWWGPIIHEYYAGSESIGGTWITSEEWLEHEGSVGRAVSGTLHVVDAAGRDLPLGEVGEIRFSGIPRFSYLGAPEKTEAAYDAQGRATYGDLGWLDEYGYLYLSARRADLIISGGVNIYPAEVEAVLSRHPLVADVAVIGVPDAEFGEQVRAFIQLREPETDPAITENELIGFCRESLSHVKCPRSVAVVPRLPRTETGKLLRRVLKEQSRREAAHPYSSHFEDTA